jgi:hypothetical protein
MKESGNYNSIKTLNKNTPNRKIKIADTLPVFNSKLIRNKKKHFHLNHFIYKDKETVFVLQMNILFIFYL